MKNMIFVILLLATLPLSACGKHENPLTKADIDQLVSIVHKNKTKEIEFCGLQWANQSAAKSDDLKKCESVAAKLIPVFQGNGFKDVTAKDIEFPSLWISFNKRAKAAPDHKSSVKQFNDAFKLPHSTGKKN